MTKKKIKILRISILCMFAVALIGGLTTGFLMNNKNIVPPKVEIIQQEEESYLSVKANSEFIGYRFLFKYDDNKIVVNSNKNVVSLTECISQGLEVGRSYSISACYTAKEEKNNSKFSKSTIWRAEGVLKAPKINYSEAENKIYWSPVLNADYYMVFYNEESAKSVKVEGFEFSLQNIPYGERTFWVVACSNHSFYKTSRSSNVIEITIIGKVCAFENLTFEDETKILSMQNKDDIDQIFVYIGDKEYASYKFTKSFDRELNVYKYEIDLSSIYNSGERIGVKPADKGEFYKYMGDIIYLS